MGQRGSWELDASYGRDVDCSGGIRIGRNECPVVIENNDVTLSDRDQFGMVSAVAMFFVEADHYLASKPVHNLLSSVQAQTIATTHPMNVHPATRFSMKMANALRLPSATNVGMK